jgi:hypothetical protein
LTDVAHELLVEAFGAREDAARDNVALDAGEPVPSPPLVMVFMNPCWQSTTAERSTSAWMIQSTSGNGLHEPARDRA